MIKNIYHLLHTRGWYKKKPFSLVFLKKIDPSGFTLSLSGNSNKQRVQFMHVSAVIATLHTFPESLTSVHALPISQESKDVENQSSGCGLGLGPTTARAAAGYTPSPCMEEAAPSSTCSPEPPSCPGCTEEAPGPPPHPHRRPWPILVQLAACRVGTARKMEGKSPACRE